MAPMPGLFQGGERFLPPCEPTEFRKVLECGSPLPLWPIAPIRKRQGAAALQDAGAAAEVQESNARIRPEASLPETAPGRKSGLYGRTGTAAFQPAFSFAVNSFTSALFAGRLAMLTFSCGSVW